MPTVDEVLASDNPLSLAADFEGHCPCCWIDGGDFAVEIHCWRQKLSGCACKYSGIHVQGLPADVAQRVAEHVRDNNGWTEHTDFEIVVEEK